MKIKKYLKWALPVALLLLSIKPIIFTRNLILANYHLRGNPRIAGKYMYDNLEYKPSVYRAFKSFGRTMIDDLIVKKAIYAKHRGGKNPFDLLEPKAFSPVRFASVYKDNFYFRHFFPEPAAGPCNRQNLDIPALEVMADPAMNDLTLSLLAKAPAAWDEPFIDNLLAFCTWKNNIPLRDDLMRLYNRDIMDEPVVRRVPLGPGYDVSLERTATILTNNFGLAADGVGENRLKSPAFDDETSLGKNWYFSKMASREPFGAGSFVMGLHEDVTGSYLRIMGLYIEKTPGTSPPRGGARYRETPALQPGFYVFSFDYLTRTGQEKPSFFLWRGIVERRLPPTRGQWRKAVFVLNNVSGQHTVVKPLLRMWGTGSLLVDNVSFVRVTAGDFSIPGPYALLIRKWN